jgi:hypothetical protein
MKLIPPSRLTFWRSVFALTGLLPFLAIYQILGSTEKLGVDLSVSRPWQGLILVLALIGLLSAFLLALAFSRYRERLLSLMELLDRLPSGRSGAGVILVAVALAGYSVLFMIPAVQRLFGSWG